MDKKIIVDLLKYSTPYSILIVDYNGRLKELFCPFHVKAKYSISTINSGQTYQVKQVLLSETLSIVFRINGVKYYYYHFEILI